MYSVQCTEWYGRMALRFCGSSVALPIGFEIFECSQTIVPRNLFGKAQNRRVKFHEYT